VATIDIVFLAIFGVLALRCCIKGFSREIIAIASFALGIVAAVFLFHPLAGILRAQVAQFAEMPVVPEIVAFLGILLIICLAGGFAGRAAQRAFEKLQLAALDHGLGFLLGLAEGLAIVSLLLLLLGAAANINVEKVAFLSGLRDAARGLAEQSVVARALLPLIDSVKATFLQSGVGGV
jgi:uncharacterized membrane protein required for colicin V production